MTAVRSVDLDWIRRDTPTGMTVRSAVPDGFEVYGLLDLDFEDVDGDQEALLLDAFAPEPDDQLTAGWILRNGLVTEHGDEHDLYAHWTYRLRRLTSAALRAHAASPDGTFPDLLFPSDHSWLVSTLWDDSWRSIGASSRVALEIQRRLPSFELIEAGVDIRTTGREVR